MHYLYAYIVDTNGRFSPRIVAHRVMRMTETSVYVEREIVDLRSSDVDEMGYKVRRRRVIKCLSRLLLNSQGYASDGIRTYYTTRAAVQDIGKG